MRIRMVDGRCDYCWRTDQKVTELETQVHTSPRDKDWQRCGRLCARCREYLRGFFRFVRPRTG